MNRITRKFADLKKAKRAALIPFVVAGDPSLSVTEKLILELEKSGADIIEIGVPFSDPIADGPTIQAAFDRALKKNISLENVFTLVKNVRRRSQVPLILMLSVTLIHRYGIEKFAARARAVGIDGVIPPDLPPEEAKEITRLFRSQNLATIFLAAPTSTPARLRAIARASTGFIYLVSVTGITGVRKSVAKDLPEFIRRVRRVSKLPLAVGFGISTPEQAHDVAKLADGVVVGSALVKKVHQSVFASGQNKQVGRFVRLFRSAVE